MKLKNLFVMAGLCVAIVLTGCNASSATKGGLIGGGAGAAVGQFGITAAYKYAPAREISIYDYTLVIFAAIWSFIFFGELPDWISIIGYVLIFGMSALMFLYNNRHAESAK